MNLLPIGHRYKQPRRRQTPEQEWWDRELECRQISCQLPNEFDEAIQKASRLLMLVQEGHAVLWEGRVISTLTPLQNGILKAMEGCLLTKDQLADKLNISGGNLYRNGDMRGLLTLGLICKARGGGYFRPDAPPPGAVVIDGAITRR